MTLFLNQHQTDNYEITQSDLGAWINLPFLNAQSLTAATKQYRISIGANLHPTDSVGIDVSDDGITIQRKDYLIKMDSC